MECAIELLFQYLTPTQKYNILNILTPKRTIFWESKPSKWYLGIDEVGMLRPSYAKPLGYLNLPSFDKIISKSRVLGLFITSLVLPLPHFSLDQVPTEPGGLLQLTAWSLLERWSGWCAIFLHWVLPKFLDSMPSSIQIGHWEIPHKWIFTYENHVSICIWDSTVGHKPNSKPSSIDS